MSAPAVPADAVRQRGPVRRWLRRILLVAAVLVAIPVVLVPLYLVVPPVSTLMIYSRLFGPVERTWVPLAEMAPSLAAAVVVSEDGRYCEHAGVDFTELEKVVDRVRGPNRGASTVAMQAMKNLFLWSSPFSYVRKALEIPLALYGDFVWGKKRMMEIYLNIAEWGPGIFGAEAAAQAYFRHSARNLSPAEAALLVAALPNPIERNPGSPSHFLKSRASVIAARVRRGAGYFDCLKP